MDSGSGVKWYIVLLVLILMVGLGFAGYYLGRYMTLQSRGSNASDELVDIKTKEFSSTSLGISFKYPERWSVREETSGGASIIRVTTDRGSELVYTYREVEEGEMKYCSLADKEGNEDLAEKCTFFTGLYNNNFARFADLQADPTGDLWKVAEIHPETDPSWMKYDSNNGFVINIKDTNDMQLFDDVLRTVRR